MDVLEDGGGLMTTLSNCGDMIQPLSCELAYADGISVWLQLV